MRITSCIMRDEGGFRDEQSARCGSTLRIVRCTLRTGNVGCIRSETRQGCKDNTMLKCQLANVNRFEERGGLLGRGHELEEALGGCSVRGSACTLAFL